MQILPSPPRGVVSRRRRLTWCWAALTLWLLVDLAWLSLASHGETPFAVALWVDPTVARIPELMTLPGMGRTRAAAIVLHRVRHGPIRRVADLALVDGIGAGTVERWRPFLRIRGAESDR